MRYFRILTVKKSGFLAYLLSKHLLSSSKYSLHLLGISLIFARYLLRQLAEEFCANTFPSPIPTPPKKKRRRGKRCSIFFCLFLVWYTRETVWNYVLTQLEETFEVLPPLSHAHLTVTCKRQRHSLTLTFLPVVAVHVGAGRRWVGETLAVNVMARDINLRERAATVTGERN